MLGQGARRAPIMYGIVGDGVTLRLFAAAFASRVAKGRREYLVRTWERCTWSDLAWVDAYGFRATRTPRPARIPEPAL